MRFLGSSFRRTAVAAATAFVLVAGGSLAYADGLVADADALIGGAGSGNSTDADQARGTTFDYDLSALIKNTGNTANDVLAATGDTVTVTITRSGDWVVAPPNSGAPASFTFSAYEVQQTGKVSVYVPCDAPADTKTMTVNLSATASNGKTLSPDSVRLTYDITPTGTCATTNHAPEVAADQATVSVHEGSQATNTGTWSDADVADTVTLSASYGTVIKNPAGTWSWSATPADGPSTSQVTITATDNGTPVKTATTTFELNVLNVAPSVGTLTLAESIDCRVNAALSFSFSDPGVNDNDWVVAINWGDGSTDTYNASAQGAQSKGHEYTNPGTYTVSVTVTDKDADTSAAQTADIDVLQTYATTFLAPFDGASPSNLVTNTMKNGRVVPVKIKIYDECSLSYVTDPTESVTIKTSYSAGSTSGADPVESYADAGASSAGTNQFRWSTDGFWIYNLDSKALGLITNNTYRVDAYVDGVKATTDTWALLKPVK